MEEEKEEIRHKKRERGEGLGEGLGWAEAGGLSRVLSVRGALHSRRGGLVLNGPAGGKGLHLRSGQQAHYLSAAHPDGAIISARKGGNPEGRRFDCCLSVFLNICAHCPATCYSVVKEAT